MGYSLENHLETVFQEFGIRYARQAITEQGHKPDFLFPDKASYHDLDFPAANLRMLGVKSTCKDRWRQVLTEAARIEHKHLLTLEPGISETQTAQMQAGNLRLVLPTGLHETYQPDQRRWLINLFEFISLV